MTLGLTPLLNALEKLVDDVRTKGVTVKPVYGELKTGFTVKVTR